MDLLVDSPATTRCPWKGKASYSSLIVDGQVNDNAAWTYPKPIFLVRRITDQVVFWHGVRVADRSLPQ